MRFSMGMPECPRDMTAGLPQDKGPKSEQDRSFVYNQDSEEPHDFCPTPAVTKTNPESIQEVPTQVMNIRRPGTIRDYL